MTSYVVAVNRDEEGTLAEIFEKAGIAVSLPENQASPRRAVLDLSDEQRRALAAIPELVVEEPRAHGTNPPYPWNLLQGYKKQ